MRKNEIFLSHSSADQIFAIELVEMMRRHDIHVWFSKTNIIGAQQWHDEIGAALNSCDWFALILSPNSVKSIWVKRELIYALQQNRFENRIVPLLYQTCDFARLSWVLPSFQIIDFQNSLDDGSRDLLRIWGLDYVSK